MTSFLPPDDLPPSQVDQLDALLRQQLEASISKYLFESCDGVTQSVLSSCEWYITIDASAMMLVIQCPDMTVNWRVVNNLVLLGTQLAEFSKDAKIRICPPDEQELPYELRVDEISMYRDLL